MLQVAGGLSLRIQQLDVRCEVRPCAFPPLPPCHSTRASPLVHLMHLATPLGLQTKTKDNVFVDVVVSVQYQASAWAGRAATPQPPQDEGGRGVA